MGCRYQNKKGIEKEFTTTIASTLDATS